MGNKTEHSGKAVLVIFAHPDDAEMTSGGTIARWADEGHSVTYVVCTDGSRGTGTQETSSQAVAKTRKEEQQAAARVLGVKEVLFLDQRDGELDRVQDNVRLELVRLIQEYRLHRVVTWDPWRPYQLHRDHAAAGYAAFYATVESSMPVFRKKQGGHTPRSHQVEELYLFGTDKADTWVDISAFVGKKREAIRCHESQVARRENVEERLLAWNEALGQRYGVSYAEVFKVLRPHCEI